MEIIFRFGADKRKNKQILELQKAVDDLNKEVRELRIDKGILELKLDKKDRSINYYKKKLGLNDDEKKKTPSKNQRSNRTRQASQRA